jgi:hypothetical protein
MAASAQTATPTPGSEGDYSVRSSVEIGYRFRSVDGSDQKFRSDFDYKAGVRVFDSSFFVENNTKEGWFDSALIMGSGWGADPTGMFRLNMEKAGAYRVDSNIRRFRYFNNLINHVNPNNTPSSLHNAKLTHTMSDFDVTVFPESETFRLRLGFSLNRTSGPAGYTHRAYSDEFGVQSNVDSGSDDFRFGTEGRLLGFNMGLHYGHRDYRDRTNYFLSSASLGNNPTNNARLFTFNRTYPIDGDTDYLTIICSERSLGVLTSRDARSIPLATRPLISTRILPGVIIATTLLTRTFLSLPAVRSGRSFAATLG